MPACVTGGAAQGPWQHQGSDPCSLGNAWSPPAFQGYHTVLVAFWGGSSYSGVSGADGSVPTAGCTFEEESDPNQCEYSQGEDDDFDWELIRSYLMPHLPPDLPHGESWAPPGSLCPYPAYVSCTPGLGYVTPPGFIPAVF